MYQVGDACYATPSAALTSMASRMFGTAINEAGQQYSYFTTVQDLSLVTHLSTGAEIVVTPTIHQCQLITPQQSLVYSFAVISAWAAVWALMLIRRGLSDDNNA